MDISLPSAAQPPKATALQDISDTPSQAALARLTRLAARLFAAPISALTLRASDSQTLRAAIGLDAGVERDIEFFAAITHTSATQIAVLVVPDTTLDARFAALSVVTGEAGIRFFAGAPLVAADGVALGTLCVMDTQPRAWSDEDSAVLSDLAALAVDKLELRRAARAAAQQLAISRQQEAALADSEARTRSIIESAHDAFIGMNAQGLITDWNRQAQSTFGWSYQEAVGRALGETIVPPQYREAHWRGLQKFLESGEGPVLNRSFEITAVHRDGHEFPIELSIAPLRWGETQLFIAFIRDISERHQIERDLRDSQERVKLALAAGNMGAWEMDLISRRAAFSDNMETVFGFAPGAFSGTIDEFLQLIHPDDRVFMTATMAQLIASGIDPKPEFRIVRPDGSVRWMAGMSQLIRDENGIPTRIVGLAMDITERKAAEVALQREQQFLKVLLENLQEGIVACDAEGNLTLFNRATREFHGLPLAPLPPDRWAEHFDLFRADSQSPLPIEEIPLFRALQGESVRDAEMVIAPKNGVARIVSANGQALFDESGQKIGAVVVMHDITSRKQAEQAVQESERRFAAFMRNTPGVAFIKDNAGRYVYVNQSFEDIFGLQLSDVKGKSDDELWPAEVAAQFKANDDQVLISHQALQTVETVPQDDGLHFWLTTKFPIIDESGGVEMVGGAAIDITDRQRAQDALRENEARLRMALSVGKMGAWEIDLQTMSARFSDNLEALLGVETGTFSHRHEDFMAMVHPEDRERLQNSMTQLIAGGEDPHPEFRMTRPDGGVRWMSSMAQLLRDENGRPARLVGVTMDIDERHRAEARLKAFAAELERSNRELQEFAYVASHDLQEPLRKIQVFNDLLKAHAASSLDRKTADYLDRIQNAAERMQVLIRDLLEYSRVATKGRPFVDVDLGNLTREVVGDLEARVRQSGGRVEIGPLPTLEADATQMRQLMQNLIGNALKFQRPGVPPIVRVIAEEIEGAPLQWRVEVRDNGIGFDPKFLDRIFTPFQRLHGREEFEGTGMGLSICRKIVERHGGAITAHSAPEQGTTFIVTLPRRQVAS